MKIIRKVELKPGSYEEELPGISAEFPYIASYVELDKYAGKQSPWHWHKGRRSCFTWSRAAWNMTRLRKDCFYGWFRGL